MERIIKAREDEDKRLEDQRMDEDSFIGKWDDKFMKVKKIFEEIQKDGMNNDINPKFVDEMLRDLV